MIGQIKTITKTISKRVYTYDSGGRIATETLEGTEEIETTQKTDKGESIPYKEQ